MVVLKFRVPIITAIVFTININAVYTELSGQGVCWENITRDVVVPLTSQATYQEISYYVCLGLPPLCSVTTNHTITNNSFQVLKESFMVVHCCNGFKQSEEKNSCIPICSKYCEDGMCTGSNICMKCVSGFSEPECIPDCLPGTYGSNCTSNCSCINENFYCNPLYGCVCKTGYAGPECKAIATNIAVSPAELVIIITIIFTLIFMVAYLIEKARDGGYSWRSTTDENTPIITEHVTDKF